MVGRYTPLEEKSLLELGLVPSAYVHFDWDADALVKFCVIYIYIDLSLIKIVCKRIKHFLSFSSFSTKRRGIQLVLAIF